MVYVLVALLLIVLLFVLTHLRPLSESEIKRLADKRRDQKIAVYFSVDRREREPDMDFKKSMDSNGRFYRVDYALHDTPSTIAALLKYKKHEWIVLGFEKEKRVDKLWVNKGMNRSSAHIGIPVTDVRRLALQYHYSSVVAFHNHPNPNPNIYNCTQPSPADLDTATQWAQALNPSGVNVVKFICERGHPYRYLLSPADSFFPICAFIESINQANNISRFRNFKLHLERIL